MGYLDREETDISPSQIAKEDNPVQWFLQISRPLPVHTFESQKG